MYHALRQEPPHALTQQLRRLRVVYEMECRLRRRRRARQISQAKNKFYTEKRLKEVTSYKRFTWSYLAIDAPMKLTLRKKVFDF
jgi:hypothetical protein